MTDGAPVAGDPDGRLRSAVDSLLDYAAGRPPIAVGWATVDLDRMERDFNDAYPGSAISSLDLPDDVLLGARCRRIRPGVSGVPTVVLVEPSTEGRLAATLARHGEGPAAIWLAGTPDPLTAAHSTAPGPFGPEWLLDGPIHGPHRLVVLAEAGTITS
jgi:hypothetical protein